MADGDFNIAHWVYLFVGIIVLVLIVAALFPELSAALTNYSAAEPVFGPILLIVVPIVVGAALLLLVVRKFMQEI